MLRTATINTVGRSRNAGRRGRNAAARPSTRSGRRVRRRRHVVLAVLVAVAIVVPIVAIVGSVEAHPPPVDPDPDPDMVWPPGVAVDPDAPGLYEYFWDPATRAMVPAHDFVRVAPGGMVDLHMRANDAVSFGVCPSVDSLQQCRDDSLHVAAGGTCGEAVAYANSDDDDAVLGHHHVITLCSGMYAMSGLTMLSGGAYASVTAKPGPITGDHPDVGVASRGVIEVTAGADLGVAQAEYCMTSYPIPCRRRALIDIVVEPEGWTDARVVGVDDDYRLDLDWSQQVAFLYAGNNPVPVGTYCCLSNPDFWSFDLQLPVMLGSEEILTGRDKVVFLGLGGADLGDTLCRPLYCEQIVPKNPTVSGSDSIGVDVEAVGKNLHVTLWGNSIKDGIQPQTGSIVTPVIKYCLAHWQQSCGGSTCAKATYRNAPNLTLASWMNVVPPSAYLATEHCPDPAEVSITVQDVTSATFDLEDLKDFVAPEPVEDTPVAATEGAPPWAYRPEPAPFAPEPPAGTEPWFWCFPGRFLDGAIGDLEGDATEWIDDPATTAVSAARITRFEWYYGGSDADGGVVPGWAPLPGRDRDPDTDEVRNRDRLVAQIIEREYQAILLDPDAFPDSDPTLGQVWVDKAAAVYNEFVADFVANFARHYLEVTLPENVADPIPTPDPAPTFDEFIDEYLTLDGDWYVDPTVGPDFDYVTMRDQEVFAEYDDMFADEWDRESLWQGLVQPDYPAARGVAEPGGSDSLLHPVGYRLVENPGAQARSCLAEGATMTIVQVRGTYPGAENWGPELCGYGLRWDLLPDPDPPPSDSPFAWRKRDVDCPLDARLHGATALPVVWLRDNPDDPDDPDDDPDDPLDDVYDPSLGASWEAALDAVTPCVDVAQCDIWAPPIPGFYQVRIRIERKGENPFENRDGCGDIPFGEPAPSPECAYHRYMASRSLLPSLGWSDYWGPPPTDPAPYFEFDDLIWVADLRVDAVQ